MVFIFSCVLLGLITGLVYLGSVIYDVSGRQNIQPYIFQPRNLSKDRINEPIALKDFPEQQLKEALIKKFVYEYFYVIPDMNDLDRRARSGGFLSNMSSTQVFEDWKKIILPELSKYAQAGHVQHVVVHTPINQSGDYWEVNYELIYNDTPNRMDALPKSESNHIYIMYDYEPGLRESFGGKSLNIKKYLDKGGDPAGIFKFRVTKVAV